MADQCVKCGLCLSACPTYRLFINEADSPRGRITLIQSLLNHQINASDEKLQQHLDGCLYCGNCEAACPSGVSFITLLDQAKARYPVSPVGVRQLSLLSSGALFSRALKLARFVPRAVSGLLPGFWGNMLKRKPETTGTVSCIKSTHKENKGRIGVFTGCTGQVIDADAINLTCQLLSRLGYRVIAPAAQTCCGAMHLHEGFPSRAFKFSEQNTTAFNAGNFDTILYFASGCGAQLQQLQSDLNAPLLEASQFLASLQLPETSPSEKQQTIAIHSPCTLINQTSAWPVMLGLVKKLAGNQLLELPGNDICCGSAGLHLIKHPDTADRLMKPKINALQQIKPDILLTSNTGCALHFRNSIRETGLEIQIMHPAEWVSKQLLGEN